MQYTRLLILAITLAVLTVSGCSDSNKPKAAPKIAQTGLIGDYAEVVGFAPVPVEGYCLAANLPGTGSSECPPLIRTYLRQYILSQLPPNSTVSADGLINSLDTAVVKIEGVIPAGAYKGESFDLKVTALPGTQTTSLAGGRLYTAELTLPVSSKKIATGEGPLYLDPADSNNKLSTFVLGGGRNLEDYSFTLSLRNPDYMIANAIRNKINERFEDGTALADSESVITVKFPAAYKTRKMQFMSLIKAIHIGETKEQESARVDGLIKMLSEPDKADDAENALLAIGRPCQDRVVPVLGSPDAGTRFHAARCLMQMGNDAGFNALTSAATDKSGAHRVEAIQAIAEYGPKIDARLILKRLIEDPDFKVRLAAYEALRGIGDPIITPKAIARGDFEIDQVKSPGDHIIYVYRSMHPRIVIFGSPLYTVDDVYAELPDGSIIVNSNGKNKPLSVIRKNPRRGNIMGPIKTTSNVAELIRVLCDDLPAGTDSKGAFGLGASYSDAVALLQTMCQKGMIKADFHLGPLPVFKATARPLEKPGQAQPAQPPKTNTK
jgi:flagellar basal body P-ring protein FlgI